MSTSRRRDFLGLMSTSAATALSGRAQTSRRPNFLILVTDDQGIGDVGCYGHPEVRTPNLDRLASSGVRFTQWYANAPVCSASRAAIMTGKYPDRAGVRGALQSEPSWDIGGLRQGESTLPGSLRSLGYRTAAFGKWHLGSAPASRPLARVSIGSSAGIRAGSTLTPIAIINWARIPARSFTTSGGTKPKFSRNPIT